MQATLITGPVTGGSHGTPFTAAAVDLVGRGYIEDEWFIEGAATTYEPAGEHGADGKWDVRPSGEVDFRTRLLVRRPAEATRASGTLLVEWLNVSGHFDIDAQWLYVEEEVLRSGHTWVGVSAQRAGVNLADGAPGHANPLTKWDPERYAGLDIPDDAASYDVFTQAALAVIGSKALDGVDVRRVVACGQSQSAHRLATYVNAVHPGAGLFDGFLVSSRFGGGAPLAGSVMLGAKTRFRDDLDVPVLALNTESEALGTFPVRQPDTERFRYWEIAGAAHQPLVATRGVEARLSRDFGFAFGGGDGPLPDNDMPVHHVNNAALAHLVRWISGGASPPSFPPITIDGEPPQIMRDAFGNAEGGIRLPHLTVATAEHGATGIPLMSHRLRGYSYPFGKGMLRMLHGSKAGYLTKVDNAIDTATTAGCMLPADAPDARRLAESVPDF